MVKGLPLALVMGSCAAASAQNALPLDLSNPVVVEGLEAWRKPGAILNGSACVACHAPDGFDLAFIGFSEQTIRRRFAPHAFPPGTPQHGNPAFLQPEDEDKIVALVHHLRSLYNIHEPKDPDVFRPFQPGGEILEGETARDRDIALGQSLRARGFPLLNAPILSSRQADEAIEATLGWDHRDQPIGIEYNRWSEDAHFGNAHAHIGNWLPEQALVPFDDASAEVFHDLSDQYLADPSWDNYALVRETMDEVLETPTGVASGELSRFKYRSVLLAQHLFRLEASGQPSWREMRPQVALHVHELNRHGHPRVNGNEFWGVGEIARQFFDGRDDEFLFDPLITDGLVPPLMSDQLYELRLPWMFLGWQFQPSTARMGFGNETEFVGYFSQILRSNGAFSRSHSDSENAPDDGRFGRSRAMINHLAYMHAVRWIYRYFDADSEIPGRSPRALGAGFNGFTSSAHPEDGWRYPLEDDPRITPEQWSLYNELVTQIHRVALVALRDALRQGQPVNADRFLGYAADELAIADPQNARHYQRMQAEIMWHLNGHPYVRTDHDLDGATNVYDVIALLRDYDQGSLAADFTNDGRLNVSDVVSMVQEVGDSDQLAASVESPR